MTTPVLHLLVGPNGSGKSTFHERLLGPITGLELVSADLIAAARWPGEELPHAYEAAELAHRERQRRMAERSSFVAETVFSHPSKLELLTEAQHGGYLVTVHVFAVSEDQAVARVRSRVVHGGHDVPEEKVRQRHARLWANVAAAIPLADHVVVYDNSRAPAPFRVVLTFRHGVRYLEHDPPEWLATELRSA